MLLSTKEAFHAILRAKHPEREDLQQIDSYRWFRDRRVVRWFDACDGGNNVIQDQAYAFAYEALDLLKAGVKSQNIRLRGCLNGARPDDIDPIDAREGELDVFAGTLKIYESKDTFRTSGIYTSVHCYADDLPLPDGDKVLSVMQTRYPNDAALIEEGVQMAFAGKQYRAIARDLAPRAEGKAILESKEDRLRTAISREHKRRLGGLWPPNISH